nr:pregnancy associated mouse protein 1, PAMP1, female specific mouse protein, FSMP {N-terminal} [mice, plasma, Peptide Partial, 15 aa] [Mus sp.]
LMLDSGSEPKLIAEP